MKLKTFCILRFFQKFLELGVGVGVGVGVKNAKILDNFWTL
jgi:hypothetical protein